MGVVRISSPESLARSVDVGGTLGVSAGRGMTHVAHLRIDQSGRSSIDSRVLDVDPTDGLNPAGRVNTAIDVMQAASDDGDFDTTRICVAVRPGGRRNELRYGVGRRRRVRVVDESAAVVRYLSGTGLLDAHESVLVIDCGDTGMTMSATSPETREASDVVRSTALSGKELDRQIAHVAAENHGWARRPTATQIAACRTAKEELFSVENRVPAEHVRVTVDDVAQAVGPLLDAAAADVSAYIAERMNGRAPQLAIVVGGLANIPDIVDGLVRGAGIPAVAAPSPELAAALGAALMARDAESPQTRTVVMGGSGGRQMLATAPAVLTGLAIGAIAISLLATGASSNPDVSVEPSSTPHPAVISDVSILTSRTAPDDGDEPGEATVTQTTPDGAAPGWATTRLDPTTAQRTRTLVPTTLPPGATPPDVTSPDAPSSSVTTTLPFGPSGIPLPPNLIPSGLLPPRSTAPMPERAPSSSTPSSSTPQARANHRRAPNSAVPQRTPPPPVVPQR